VIQNSLDTSLKISSYFFPAYVLQFYLKLGGAGLGASACFFYYSLLANAGFGRPSGTEIAPTRRNFKTCLLSSPAVRHCLSFYFSLPMVLLLCLGWAVQDLNLRPLASLFRRGCFPLPDILPPIRTPRGKILFPLTFWRSRFNPFSK